MTTLVSKGGRKLSIFHRKKDTARKPQLETFDGDILLSERSDRRILPDVPDPTGQRSALDRRGAAADGEDVAAIMKKRKSGIRFKSKFPVTVVYKDAAGKNCTVTAESRDISDTGLLLTAAPDDLKKIETAGHIQLRFRIHPGSMPRNEDPDRRHRGAQL